MVSGANCQWDGAKWGGCYASKGTNLNLGSCTVYCEIEDRPHQPSCGCPRWWCPWDKGAANNVDHHGRYPKGMGGFGFCHNRNPWGWCAKEVGEVKELSSITSITSLYLPSPLGRQWQWVWSTVVCDMGGNVDYPNSVVSGSALPELANGHKGYNKVPHWCVCYG